MLDSRRGESGRRGEQGWGKSRVAGGFTCPSQSPSVSHKYKDCSTVNRWTREASRSSPIKKNFFFGCSLARHDSHESFRENWGSFDAAQKLHPKT